MKRLQIILSVCLLPIWSAPSWGAEDAKLPPLPAPYRTGENTEPLPPPTGSKMLGANAIVAGEKVYVVGVNNRPVPIYTGTKVVGYLHPQKTPSFVEELKQIGSQWWARLDTMKPDTWVTVAALEIVPQVQIGMTRNQVANRIGQPSRINVLEDGEEWTYEAFEVLVDRQFVEGKEKHSSLVPVQDPNDPSRLIYVPTYWETVKRYSIDNPYWAKVLDKRFIFREGRLVEIKNLK